MVSLSYEVSVSTRVAFEYGMNSTASEAACDSGPSGVAHSMVSDECSVYVSEVE